MKYSLFKKTKKQFMNIPCAPVKTNVKYT